jgi:hypothetical protein
MSRREIEGGELVESGNVVRLQPLGAMGARNSATAAPSAPALEVPSSQPEAITRDALELLKAFFAIDDAAARGALVILAQRLAEVSSKKK